MQHYAWVFLVIAMVAAVFGFGEISKSAITITKAAFYVCLAVFIASVLLGRKKTG
jgi:uncharacterized membrane protein YtjA (UPF0391 family)